MPLGSSITKRGYYKERAWLKVCEDCGVEFRKSGTRWCYKCRKKREKELYRLAWEKLTPEERLARVRQAVAYHRAHPDKHRISALRSYHKHKKAKPWNGRY